MPVELHSTSITEVYLQHLCYFLLQPQATWMNAFHPVATVAQYLTSAKWILLERTGCSVARCAKGIRPVAGAALPGARGAHGNGA